MVSSGVAEKVAFLESVMSFAEIDEVGVSRSVGKLPQVSGASDTDRA